MFLCTCCAEPRMITYVPDGESFHIDDNTYASTLHCHIESSGSDCDGHHGHSQTIRPATTFHGRFADDEYAWQREVVKLAIPGVGGRLDVLESGYEAFTPHDEGGSHESGAFCTDPECAYDRSSQYDQFAELAGY